jgi:hypothetical protein
MARRDADTAEGQGMANGDHLGMVPMPLGDVCRQPGAARRDFARGDKALSPLMQLTQAWLVTMTPRRRGTPA